jgi:hypothetical protein
MMVLKGEFYWCIWFGLNTSVLNEDGRSIVGFVSALVLMK